MSKQEIQLGMEECLNINGSYAITAVNAERDMDRGGAGKKYNLDRVFQPSESQADVFEVSCAKTIKSVLEGFSGANTRVPLSLCLFLTLSS